MFKKKIIILEREFVECLNEKLEHFQRNEKLKSFIHLKVSIPTKSIDQTRTNVHKASDL